MTALPPNSAQMAPAEAPLPKLYHLALTKSQIELVSTVVSNMIACHVATRLPPVKIVGFKIVDGLVVVDDPDKAMCAGSRAAMVASIAHHTASGIQHALRRFDEREGEPGFCKLSGLVNRVFVASLAEEGK